MILNVQPNKGSSTNQGGGWVTNGVPQNIPEHLSTGWLKCETRLWIALLLTPELKWLVGWLIGLVGKL